ncbi:MAG: diguanylate cyclase [Acholeplasmatales bacterium]|nr:MAG: diguanylate cyclase [Acholeplasmatales bacterium]
MAHKDWRTLIETLMTICREEKAFEPMALKVIGTLNDFFDLAATRLSVKSDQGEWYHVMQPEQHDFSCCDALLDEATPATLVRRIGPSQDVACFLTAQLGAFTFVAPQASKTLFESPELFLLVEAMDYLWSQLRKPFVSAAESEARLRSELEETQADFSWFFNQADDLFLIVDEDARIVRANSAWHQKTGAPAEQFFREGFVATVVDADKDKAQAAMDDLEKYGKMIELTIQHHIKNGDILHLRWRVKISHGLYFATAHDITDLYKQHEALEVAHARYDRIAKQSRIFAWEITLEGLYTYVSPIAKDVLGYEPKELVGKRYFYDLHPEETRAAFIKYAEDDIVNGRRFSDFINPMVHKDGHCVFVSTTAFPVLDKQGRMIAYQGSDMDVTEQVLAEQALKSKSEQFELAIEGSNDGIWDWDIKTDKLFLSKQWKNQLGYDAGDYPEPTMRDIFNCIHLEDRASANKQLIAYFKGEKDNFDAEMRMICKDGEIRWFRVRGAALRNETGRAIRMAGSQTDITAQKEADLTLKAQHETLRTLASTDPLTRLKNHRALYEELATLTRDNPGGVHVLAMLDLDNFKHVNDTYGHVYGDKVLTEVAKILKNHTAAHHVVGRYGGEEFMIVFIDTAIEAALEAVEAIRLDVETAYLNQDVPLTISAGVKPYRGEPISEWVDMADRNLYVAKRAGKNTIRT